MPYECIQIPAKGQVNMKDAMSHLICGHCGTAGKGLPIGSLIVATAFCLAVHLRGIHLQVRETNWARAIRLRQLDQLKQQRIPGSPQLRPELQPDRIVVSMGLNRPVSGSRRLHRRDEVRNTPLGVSRAAATAPKAPLAETDPSF